MVNMKNQIDYELRNLKLPDNFQQTIMHGGIKPRKKQPGMLSPRYCSVL